MKSEDILNIVHCVMVKKMSYQDSADLNHASKGLVQRIMNKAKKNKKFIIEVKSKEQEKDNKETIVLEEV